MRFTDYLAFGFRPYIVKQYGRAFIVAGINGFNVDALNELAEISRIKGKGKYAAVDFTRCELLLAGNRGAVSQGYDVIYAVIAV